MMMEVSRPPEYARTTFLGLCAGVFKAPLSFFVILGAVRRDKDYFSFLLAKERVRDCFLHVHAIFRLIQNDRLRAIENFRRDFVAAMRREAMHENSAALGKRHELPVHLIWLEYLATNFFL